MKKLLEILMWGLAVLTTLVVVMLVIGLTYNIPESSMFTEIFKASVVIWVFEICLLGITYVYVETRD